MSETELGTELPDVTGRLLFPGIYPAVVKDNIDPEMLGRLRVWIPTVHGSDKDVPKEVFPWARPCVAYGGIDAEGLVLLPNIGATLWILFEGGLPEYPVWLGTWWGVVSEQPAGTVHSEIPLEAEGPVQEEDVDQAASYAYYPDVGVLRTRGPFVLVYGRRRIVLDGHGVRIYGGDATDSTNIQIQDDGTITITAPNQITISSPGPLELVGNPITANGVPI